MQGLDGSENILGERLRLLPFAHDILRGQPQDILGRALDHEQPFPVLAD